MHETSQDIVRLQRLLDESDEKAGQHLRSIITPERRLNAQQVCDELQGMTLLSLATVTARCEPLVRPVDGIFYKGLLWFGSADTSVRFRHLRARPQVSAAHTRAEELGVIVHGIAHEIDKASGKYDSFREVLREVYPLYDSWGHWESAPYALMEPRLMFAVTFRGLAS
jgi:uncharacterized pyridoxamine 5'-phosphate oxidase family protein